MPLTPNYTWSETEASLEVTVDVPGVSRAKADVFATDAFLKVNCPPYLFALDLHKEVDDSRSAATIVPGGVVFKLFKREPGLWGRLAACGDKAELTARRNASIDRAYRELEEARKARVARKQQEDKNATQRSMEMDRRKRQEVERRKAAELAEERGRLAEWQQGLAHQQQQGGGDAESDYEDEGDEGDECEGRQGDADAATPAPDHPDYHGRGWRPPKAAAAASGGAATAASGSAGRAAAASERGGGGAGGGESGDDDDAEGEAGGSDEGEDGSVGVVNGGPPRAAAAAAAGATFKPLPPPRARLEPVQVSFTKLETGHLPAREQREEEIRAFRKQSSAAAAADPDCTDLAERQPLFLKDKGDQLFRAGNYSGALNAYSRAIRLEDCHAAVRANRAACRLALGEAAGCVQDCDRAMEMLAERRDRLDHDLLEAAEAAALRQQLLRLLVRRAQARVALAGRGGAGTGTGGSGAGGGGGGGGGGEEQLAGALRDYEEAMRLTPGDPSLESDHQELLAALEPADAAALRQRGDARFRSGDYEGAAEAFGALLGLPRSRVPESERLAAFSNRAACNLVLERYGAAVADCDAGLALLLLPQGGAAGGAAAAADFGAAAGEAGLARLSAWAQSLVLPTDVGAAPAAAAELPPGGAGLASAAAAAAAARLLTRRGAAAAHQQRFAAAAADQRLAAELLGRLGEGDRAAAAAADAERMRALDEGKEQLPPRPQPQSQSQQAPPLGCEQLTELPAAAAAAAAADGEPAAGSGSAAQGGGERPCGAPASSRPAGERGGCLEPQQVPLTRDAAADTSGRAGVDASERGAVSGGGSGGCAGAGSGTGGAAAGVGVGNGSTAAAEGAAGLRPPEEAAAAGAVGGGSASLLDEVDD